MVGRRVQGRIRKRKSRGLGSDTKLENPMKNGHPSSPLLYSLSFCLTFLPPLPYPSVSTQYAQVPPTFGSYTDVVGVSTRVESSRTSKISLLLSVSLQLTEQFPVCRSFTVFAPILDPEN